MESFIGMMTILDFIMALAFNRASDGQTWPYIRYKTATMSLSSAITAALGLKMGIGKFPRCILSEI